MNENIEIVLEKLSQCISTGQSTLGGSLSVGIYDKAARDSLTKIIIDAFNNRKDPGFNKAISDGANKLSSDITSSQEKLNEKLVKQWKSEKNIFVQAQEKFYKFTEKLPGFGKILSGLIWSGEQLIKLQLKSVDNFNLLNNAGVGLEESTTKLFEKASNIGITVDKLVQNMQDNSQRLAKMRAYFGNGEESFIKLSQISKQAAKDVGINYSTALKASMNYFDSVSTSYYILGKDISSLSSESERYIKSLQKLSLTTGKSTESILSEIEAREKEAKFRLLSADPRNKDIIAAMSALGFTNDDMISVLTGQMQESTAIASTNPAMGRMISLLQELKLSGKELKPNEILTYLQNNIGEDFKSIAQETYRMFTENPHMIQAFSQNQDILRAITTAVDVLNATDIEENKIDLGKSQELTTLREEFSKTWNKFIQAFSVEGESFTKLLNLFNDLLTKFNTKVLTDENIDKINKKLNEFLDSGVDPFVKSMKELFNEIGEVIKFIKEYSTEIKYALYGIAAIFAGGTLLNFTSSLSSIVKILPGLSTGLSGLSKTLSVGTLAKGGLYGMAVYGGYKAGQWMGLDDEKTFVGSKIAKGGEWLGDKAYALTKWWNGDDPNDMSKWTPEQIEAGRQKLLKLQEERKKQLEKQEKEQKEKLEKTSINDKKENENKTDSNTDNELNKKEKSVIDYLSSISYSVDYLVQNTKNINSTLESNGFSREVAYQAF